MYRSFNLKSIFIVLLLLALSGCAASIPKSVETIKIDTQLTQAVAFPLPAKVTYHFPAELYRERYGTFDPSLGSLFVFSGPAMKSALEFVMPSYFTNTSMLERETEFNELFVFDAETTTQAVNVSRFDYSAEVSLKVVDTRGVEKFSSSSSITVKSGAGGDQQALTNAYSAGIKENIFKYINSLPNAQAYFSSELPVAKASDLDLKLALGIEKPISSGSGFVINQDGDVLTSSHILKDCLYIEVGDKRGLSESQVKHKSVLLDLSVIDGDPASQSYARFNNEKPLSLGESVFTIGYPLSEILAGSPNLTKGDVSSTTGVKGARHYFQFTAPIQPGNSGGPLMRTNGEVLGIVTSTLIFGTGDARPQNVNFAINSDLIKRYLTNNSVTHYSNDSSEALDNAIESSKDFVVKVACYR